MDQRTRLAVYTMVWLATVVGGLILYITAPGFPLVAPFTSGQAQAVAISVWSAILGSLAISIKGLVDHRRLDEWATPNGWSLWYILRPVNGIVVGLATFAFVLVLDGPREPNLPAVAVMAFILGFQERRFLSFVSEIAKLVLTVPHDQGSGLAVTDIAPTQGQPGQPVLISGHGLQANSSVTFGSNPLLQAVVSADGSAIAGLAPDYALSADLDGRAVDVMVVNGDGSAHCLRNGFTYVRAAAPAPVAQAAQAVQQNTPAALGD